MSSLSRPAISLRNSSLSYQKGIFPLKTQIQDITDLILSSESILLTTHKQCDGDGLGAELAVYHALKSIGKRVSIINVDSTPKKYRFLEADKIIIDFEKNPNAMTGADLVLIFDTNDPRMVEPLYSQLEKKAKAIIFIDHHPLLLKGPQPTARSWIDTNAASTGELAHRLIHSLKIPLNAKIAQALYTSVTFDTQLYKFIRSSPVSHQIAAETLLQSFDALEVHRHLFGSQTMNKMSFLAKALGEIEYFENGKFAVLRITDKDLKHFQLDPDDSRDVIDMIMNIETLEAASIFREEEDSSYKVSLRSKGSIEVLTIAESLGGGGHPQAAGAFLKGDFQQIKKNIVLQLTQQLT